MRSWDTPLAASNVASVVVAHGEVGVERAERQPPAGPQRPGHPGDDRAVLAVGRHQPERALAQADHGVELGVEREGTGVEALERRAVGASWRRQVDERAPDVDAVDDDPAAGQLVGVATRPAPHVEHPRPGRSPSARDDVVDLLHRPLRERVPEVRRPEVIGDRLEPVRRIGHVYCWCDR